MAEAGLIERTGDRPVTPAELADDLRALGLRSGDVVLAHASLSALGWVCGGPVGVLDALAAVLGDDGTLVMPAHSSGLGDPAPWENPPVPESWVNGSLPGRTAGICGRPHPRRTG